MQTFDSTVWGQIPQPDDFVELISVILENKTTSPYNVSYWRGQSDIQWKLDSSIVRKELKGKPKNETPQKIESSISFWEKHLLNQAKKNLYNYDEHGRKISDIELLAKLQHFGAATRLLDFSKNVLNALWFCVSDSKFWDATGILIGISSITISGTGENDFNFDQNYDAFCRMISENDRHGAAKIWMIDAPVVTQRISAQHSVFLCSKCITSAHGYFQLPQNEKYLKVIAISPKLKKESLRIISSHFNITPYTIFPDIEGFSAANSSEWEFSQFDRW